MGGTFKSGVERMIERAVWSEPVREREVFQEEKYASQAVLGKDM